VIIADSTSSADDNWSIKLLQVYEVLA